MTEERFWRSNPIQMMPYAKAYSDRIKEEMQRQNIICYVQARYFVDSLMCTVGNMFSSGVKNEFPKEPYPFFEPQKELTEEEKSKQVELFFAELEAMQHNFELEKQGQ